MSTTTSSPADRALRFHGCPKCEKRRKMRVLRPPDDTGLEWTNCLTCNSILCFEIDENDMPVNPECVGDYDSPAPEECRTRQSLLRLCDAEARHAAALGELASP